MFCIILFIFLRYPLLLPVSRCGLACLVVKICPPYFLQKLALAFKEIPCEANADKNNITDKSNKHIFMSESHPMKRDEMFEGNVLFRSLQYHQQTYEKSPVAIRSAINL